MTVLDLLIFSVPGLMAYFWIEKFGVTPPVKPTNLEQTAIGAILWLPTYLIASLAMKICSLTLPSLKTTALSPNDITRLSWFFLFSVISSFLVSVAWVYVFYFVFLWVVNIIRKPLRRGNLRRETTVWERVFTSGNPMVVRVTKIGSTDSPIVGGVVDSSRPLSGEKNLVLEDQHLWSSVNKKGEIRAEKTFFNTDSGLQIEILSETDIQKIIDDNQDIQELFQETLRASRSSRRKRN